METRKADLVVGLFLLVTVGIVAGALIVTSGLGDVRNDLYVRAQSAEDLTSDTRVVLRGLNVGRVRDVSPVVDPATGGISFVVRLSVRDRFPNGTQLNLPVGTTALIVRPTPIAPAIIDLVVPERATAVWLAAGDTIVSDRPRSLIDALGELAQELSDDLKTAMEDTRDLVRNTNDAVRRTHTAIAANDPLLRTVLEQVTANLERTDRLLAEVEPRVGPLQDSLAVTLSDTRRLIQRMDSLVYTADAMARENREVVRETAENLRNSSIVLEHFADQVSRRPTRLLTGVRPPPQDTARSNP